jgi:hypothetical protein
MQYDLPAFLEVQREGFKSVLGCSLEELRAAETLALERRELGDDYPGDFYLRGIREAIELKLER